jgi:hypothetical protein
MKITLGQWVRLGGVTLGSDGKIVLPSPPSLPGVYRFLLSGPAPSIYIGETDQLSRRFSGYRNPGPSQRTNMRLNDTMRRTLGSGQPVIVEVVTSAWVEIGTVREPLDLARRSHRALAEEAALMEARLGSMGTIESIGG